MFTPKIINQGLSQATQQVAQHLQHAQSKLEETTQQAAQMTDRLIELNHKMSHRALDVTVKTAQSAVHHTLGQAVQVCERATESLQASDTTDETSSDLKRAGWTEQAQEWARESLDRIWVDAQPLQLKTFIERVNEFDVDQLMGHLSPILRTKASSDELDEDQVASDGAVREDLMSNTESAEAPTATHQPLYSDHDASAQEEMIPDQDVTIDSGMNKGDERESTLDGHNEAETIDALVDGE
jgi:hypothetical protein